MGEMSSAGGTALNRDSFNERGDRLDKPYVVRALKSFDVNRTDVDGFLIEGETYTVKKGSVWEIYGPSYTNDVRLTEAGAHGNVYGELDLNWGDMALFELVQEGGYYDD